MPKVATIPPQKTIGLADKTDKSVAKKDEQGVETIRTYASDLESIKAKKQAARERLAEIEANWPETREVDELTEVLAKAHEKLKAKRLSQTEYLNQTERLATVQREEKEAKEILSTYLLFHYKKTGELQILMDEENGDARQVILTGKLGRLTKYQTSMDLGGSDDDT